MLQLLADASALENATATTAPQRVLVIIDCRPKLYANANRVQGWGYEGTSSYWATEVYRLVVGGR